MSTTDLLQHPRRNLGIRYRTQATRFMKLAKKDVERKHENLEWAEHNARQSILYDFTDQENWRCLAKVKVERIDKDGLESLLMDLFQVLGRDPDLLVQIKEADLIESGQELLEAIFLNDPLDADVWFEEMSDDEVTTFASRCRTLNFTDQRANIIFGRRIERLLKAGKEDLFISLVPHLLAHRPQNHELWLQLGRLHERRKEIAQSWLCYDHVQVLLPHTLERDRFLSRMKGKMDGDDFKPWSAPTISDRKSFLEKMQKLARIPSAIDVKNELHSPDKVLSDEEKIAILVEDEKYSEAFFMARSLAANGEQWALEWVEKIRELIA